MTVLEHPAARKHRIGRLREQIQGAVAMAISEARANGDPVTLGDIRDAMRAEAEAWADLAGGGPDRG